MGAKLGESGGCNYESVLEQFDQVHLKWKESIKSFLKERFKPVPLTGKIRSSPVKKEGVDQVPLKLKATIQF